jgi:hypothetical protein
MENLAHVIFIYTDEKLELFHVTRVSYGS